MKRLERIFVIANGSIVIAGLVVMALVVGANVALRYSGAGSLPWADEVARYTMIWLVFLGAGLALREGAHVAISNLQDAIPSRMAWLLRLFILLILFMFFAFMVKVGLEYMQRASSQRSAALRLPMSWVYAAMPAGFALLLVHLALIAPRYLRHGFNEGSGEGARG